jgi:hypothetical protein
MLAQQLAIIYAEAIQQIQRLKKDFEGKQRIKEEQAANRQSFALINGIFLGIPAAAVSFLLLQSALRPGYDLCFPESAVHMPFTPLPAPP